MLEARVDESLTASDRGAHGLRLVGASACRYAYARRWRDGFDPDCWWRVARGAYKRRGAHTLDAGARCMGPL